MEAGVPRPVAPRSSGCSRRQRVAMPLRLADWAALIALIVNRIKALPYSALARIASFAYGKPHGYRLDLHGFGPLPPA